MIYQKEKTEEISFPLGGLGTGSIGLAGNGRLRDWEIYNRPFKNSANGFSHLLVRAEDDGGVVDARVLQGDWSGPATGGETVNIYRGTGGFGHGHGPYRGTMAGVPHFREHTFEGAYPYATLRFADECFPGRVQLRAFNPFIPLNEADSSLPAAFFEVTFTNTSEKPLDYTAFFTLNNPLPYGTTVNRVVKRDGQHRITMGSDALNEADLLYGTLCLATDGTAVSCQESWARTLWFDSLVHFWDDVNKGGPLPARSYAATPGGKTPYLLDGEEHGTLAVHLKAAPGAQATARFVVAWHFPNCENYWHPDPTGAAVAPWKNYYAGQFADAEAVAAYALEHWGRLDEETGRFHAALFSTTLPPACLDAASANLSILKSPTCLRLENGELFGFEGADASEGSCEGSCTHVWNYAQALPYLFPALQRSMRDLDYRYNQREDGGMSFRLMLPLGRARQDFRPCVDGQMGCVVQVWRDYLLSGDKAWLAGKWPYVKKAIEFAWAPTNEDGWDADKDGVMEGRQHHTMDMELFGPSSWLNGFYLAALKAGAKMAALLGHAAEQAEYSALYEKGRAWCDEHLFNGEYYQQKVDLADKDLLLRYDVGKPLEGDDVLDAYWSGAAGEMRYQVANGSLVDQVMPQWQATLSGLGDVFDPAQVRSALRAVYRYNFMRSAREAFNPARVYCLDDEAGVRICAWPQGAARPRIPITYAEEVWCGCEYQVAAHMVQAGLVQEGFEIVEAVRARFDGARRNPWNEFECGNNYARSMASFSLIPAASGFSCDMGEGAIGFDPTVPWSEGFTSFFGTGTGWGTVQLRAGRMELRVQYGTLRLNRLGLPAGFGPGRAVQRDGEAVGFAPARAGLAFEAPVLLAAGQRLTVHGEEEGGR